MIGQKSVELTGLRGDHPLSFLATCGLLHCIKDSNELSGTRLAWTRSQNNGAFVAILHAVEQRPDIGCLTKIINQRCEAVRQSPTYTWSTKIDDRNKYRKSALELLDPNNGSAKTSDFLAVFAALTSDLAQTGKGKLQSTLLDLTSGNQHLLKSIRTLAGQADGERQAEPITEESVSETLLGPWKYQDDYHSLGWDPQTQRLHALRDKTPTNEKTNASVRAAVFLATQALPLFPCFVHNGRLHTTGFYRDETGEDWFSWPVWRKPITLDTLRSLLAHPFAADLKARGVEVVYHCRRAATGGDKGDYRVFSQASERPWPRQRES